MRRVVLLAALLSIVTVATPEAQRRLRFVPAAGGGGGGGTGTLHLRENCGSGGSAWPECGATSVVNSAEEGTTWDWTQRNGAGPQGQTVTEMNFDSRGTGEGYFGRRWSSAIPTITQGHTIRVSFFIKFLSPQQSGSFAVKQWILGDSDPNPDESRIISTLQSWQDGRGGGDCTESGITECFAIDIDRNIDGVYSFILGPTQDTWHSVQWVIKTSSTAVATDGSFRLYFDNDVFASPTHTRSGLALPATYAGDFGFGYFGDLSDGGTHCVYQVGLIEVVSDATDSNAFDPEWSTGGAFWGRAQQSIDGWLALVTGRPLPSRGWSTFERQSLFGAIPVERAN